MATCRTGVLARATVSLLAVLAGGASCGSDDLSTFEADFPAAFCKRALACCSPADFAEATTTASLDACIAKEQAKARNGAGIVASGPFRFDAAAGHRCLADLQGPCDAVFDPKLGALAVCKHLVAGTLPLGAACDDDATCASNDCEGQRCVVRPDPCAAASCAANQFCDLAGSCQPFAAVGDACPTTLECAPQLTCIVSSHTCATPLADGETCTSPWDCAGSCTQLSAGPAGQAGTCRPGVCQGP